MQFKQNLLPHVILSQTYNKSLFMYIVVVQLSVVHTDGMDVLLVVWLTADNQTDRKKKKQQAEEKRPRSSFSQWSSQGYNLNTAALLWTV